MNELIEMLQNAAVKIKRLNSEIERVRLMKACLEDHVKSVEYHNDELRAENDKLRTENDDLKQAMQELAELNFNLAQGGPNARYVYDLKFENDKLKAIIENARQTITEVQLIDNTPREAAYVRLELLYSLQ